MRRFWISNQTIQIQSVALAIAGLVCQPHFRNIWPSPIRVIYVSSWPDFWGDSGSGHQNLKFHLWHTIQPYLCFGHISEKSDLHRSRWSIHHPDQNIEEVLNLDTEILNSISSIHIWHISVEWIFGCSRMNDAIIRDPTTRIRCQTQKTYVCIHSSRIRTFHVKYFIINCTDETATVCVPVILLSMAIRDATGGILSFWLQIQNLCKNLVQMIYRSSWLVEVQFPPKYG